MPERVATLSQNFEAQAQKYGARAFLKDKRDKVWTDHSWTEVSEAAGKLRAGLLGLGVRPGDRVAILSDNCPEWIVVDQAVLGLGAIVVPLYTTSGLEETAHVISDSGAKVIAANGPEMVRKILGIGASIPEVSAIVAMHRDAESMPAANGTPAVMTAASVSAETPAAIVEGSSDDLATIIYTSGTTGTSKGVMLSHGNLVANAEDALAALALNETDMTLSHLPIAHSFERTAGYYTVAMAGGTIAFAESLGQIASNLTEVEPTVVLTVPRLLEVIHSRVMRTVETSPPMRQRLFKMALNAGEQAADYRNRGKPVPPMLALSMALFRRLVFARVRAIFGSKIRYLISGGAPLPTEINRFLSAAEVPIVEGYGLTEAAPVVACNLHNGKTRIGTVGLPLARVQTEIAAGRRVAAARAEYNEGLLQARGRDEGSDRRKRMAAYRRHRENRRRGLHRDHRSQERNHRAVGRQERLAGLRRGQAGRRQIHQPGLRDRRPPQASGGADRAGLRKSRRVSEGEQPRPEERGCAREIKGVEGAAAGTDSRNQQADVGRRGDRRVHESSRSHSPRKTAN